MITATQQETIDRFRHAYADAKARWQAARARLENLTTKTDKRMAAEDVEFYGNRMTHFSSWFKHNGIEMQ